MNKAEKVFGEAQYELSVQYYTLALQQLTSTVDTVYILYMRGCAYKALGQVGKAKEDWHQAQSLNLKHPTGVDLVEMALAQV
ncbi:MAG TPA: hypothetical protein DCS93_06120 [Microscillaceae bacterium]|nr:hypothetical protein [Microscillaceae bacterium]